MHLQRTIYEKYLNGDPLSDYELTAARDFHKKLTDDLGKLGPAFALSAKESNRIYLAMQDFINARDRTKLDDDRKTIAYSEGYDTGLHWKESYQPGGPFHYGAQAHESDRAKELSRQSQEQHRRWMMGFKEGLAAKQKTASTAPKS